MKKFKIAVSIKVTFAEGYPEPVLAESTRTVTQSLALDAVPVAVRTTVNGALKEVFEVMGSSTELIEECKEA
jgi:hypothetical protein